MTAAQEARVELQEARNHGLQQRHKQKLDRVIRCRYLDTQQNQCTGEAVDPTGEIQLCVRHLAAAIELIRRRATGLLDRPITTR